MDEMASLLLPLGAALALIGSEPAVEPSEPAIEPSEPVVGPSEPAVEPSEPAIEPSEPAIEPSEPPTAELPEAPPHEDQQADLDAHDPPRPVFSPPPPSPQEQEALDQWERRRRRLVAQVSVSATFAVAALGLATVPWIREAACNPPPDSPHGCTDGTDIIVAIYAGLPLLAAGAVAVTVWSIRLARHRRMPPPGLHWFGSTVRLEPSASGLRLLF